MSKLPISGVLVAAFLLVTATAGNPVLAAEPEQTAPQGEDPPGADQDGVQVPPPSEHKGVIPPPPTGDHDIQTEIPNPDAGTDEEVIRPDELPQGELGR